MRRINIHEKINSAADDGMYIFWDMPFLWFLK